ncbi:unnamed protein product, partial [Symbiodinium sp. CCMP2456]
DGVVDDVDVEVLDEHVDAEDALVDDVDVEGVVASNGDVGEVVVANVDVEVVGEHVDAKDALMDDVDVAVVVASNVDVDDVVEEDVAAEDAVAQSDAIERVAVHNIVVQKAVAQDVAAEVVNLSADVSVGKAVAVEDVLVEDVHVHAENLDRTLWEDAGMDNIVRDNVGQRDGRTAESEDAAEAVLKEARKEDTFVEHVVA